MCPNSRGLLLYVIVCCGSFLTLGVTSRADTFTGTVGSSPIYSSIPVIAGDNLHVTVTSPDLGPGQSTQTRLFDGRGNLVAIATGNGSGGSSVIDFVVPLSGDWTAGVGNPAPGSYQFNLSITGETGTGMPILEQFFNGQIFPATTESVFIPSNGGDNLQFELSSLNPDSGTPTELRLYDPNGDLVAIASGNGSGGISSLISFNVPSGDGGNWMATVTDHTSMPYSYDLSVYGETAGNAYSPTTIPAPEPASLSMLLLGLSACGLFSRALSR